MSGVPATRSTRCARPIALLVVAATGFVAVLLNDPFDKLRAGPSSPRANGGALALGRATALSTSAGALDAIIAEGRSRVAADPGNGEAAVLLADALMRAARVHSDASLPVEAERVLRATLRHDPADYPAMRMLGVVLLSQHRFGAALEAARKSAEVHPSDAWNHAVAGDALLELGRYEEAFDAFDTVMQLRPDAAAYARVAYARELQGDLDGAVRLMRMAAEGTGSHDPEAQAWTYAQLGSLYLQQGRLDHAAREFDRSEFTFPSHPYAHSGRVRLLIARKQFRDALALVERGPQTPETAAIRGDLLAHLGNAAGAEAAYVESERLERECWTQEQPQPGALARFLAERGRKTSEAVQLAKTAAAERQDIHTLDALAWASYRAGRLEDASAAIVEATRTGSVDPRIQCHATVIKAVSSGTSREVAGSCHPIAIATRSHR